MLRMVKLEERFVLDGAALVEAAEQTVEFTGNALSAAADVAEELLQLAPAAFSDAELRPKLDVVLVSDALGDYQQLAAAVAPGTHVIVYDAGTDSAADILKQVTALAGDKSAQIGSLAVLAHGNQQGFNLGNDFVDQAALSRDGAQWQQLASVLADNAQVHLYGCDLLAANGSGQQVIEQLAGLTGAAVYASDDLSGQGGDWALEGSANAQAAEANQLLNLAALENYSHSLAVTVVSPVGGTISATILEGAEFGINQGIMEVTSDVDGPDEVVYSVVNTGGGSFRLSDGNGGSSAVNTFTQEQINQDLVRFFHGGGENAVEQVELSVNDSTFGAGSTASIFIDLTITPTNDSPTLDLSGPGPVDDRGAEATFTEGSGPTAIVSPNLVLTDTDNGPFSNAPDNTNPAQEIALARIFFQSAPPDGLVESLSVDVGNTGITAIYDPANGLLSLDGVASIDDYQQVLSTLSYNNTSSDPTAGDRVVAVRVMDVVSVGTDDPEFSPVARSTVTVVAVNDAPIVDLNGPAAGINTTASFVEDGGSVSLIDPALAATIIDVDNNQLQSLTVQIDNLLDGASESLSVDVGTTGLTATYDPATGLLTIANADGTPSDLSNFESVLQSLSYNNSSDNPSTLTRTISVIATDADGLDSAAPAQIAVSVAAVDDPTVIDPNGPNVPNTPLTPVNFTEDQGPVSVFPALTLTDPDNTSLTSLAISLNSPPDGSVESIVVDLAGTTGITAVTTTDPTTGTITITLTGPGSVADFQTIVQTLEYNNSSQDPTTTPRDIAISINGGVPETFVGAVTVTAVNDAPVVDLNGPAAGINTTASFVEDGGPVSLLDPTSAATIIDVDNTQLQSLTVQIDNLLDGPAESLSVDVGTTGLVATYDPATGLLTIANADGTPSDLSNFESVLQSLSYNNSSDNPSTLTRTISVTATDADGLSNTPAAQINVSLTAVDDPIVIDPNGPNVPNAPLTPVNFTEDQGPVSVFPALTLTDPDNTSLTSLAISLNSPPDGSVESIVVDLAGTTGITAVTTTDPTTGTITITLTGPGSVADFQTIVQTLEYNNSSQDPTTTPRDIAITINGGVPETFVGIVTVTAVNDAPTITVPGQQTVDEDTTLNVTGINIADVDAGTGTVQVTLSVGNGTLTLGDTTNVTVQNNGSSLLTVSGTVANINAVINSLNYQGNLNFNGVDNINVVVNDQGNSGGGGALTATDDIPINVTPVNDAPTVNTNTGLTVTAGQTGTITPDLLQVVDPDNTPDEIVFTIVTPPGSGQVLVNGMPLGVGGTFTQADINNGLVTFVPGDAGNFNFVFNVSDPDGATTGNQTFSLTVSDSFVPLDPPVPPVIVPPGDPGPGGISPFINPPDPNTTDPINLFPRTDFFQSALDTLDDMADNLGDSLLFENGPNGLGGEGRLVFPSGLPEGYQDKIRAACSLFEVIEAGCRLNDAGDNPHAPLNIAHGHLYGNYLNPGPMTPYANGALEAAGLNVNDLIADGDGFNNGPGELAAAYLQGGEHRVLKPDDIMVDADCQPLNQPGGTFAQAYTERDPAAECATDADSLAENSTGNAADNRVETPKTQA